MQYKTILSAAVAVGIATAQSTTDLASLIAANNLTALGGLLGSFSDITAALAAQQNVTFFAPSNEAIAALNSTGALATLASQPDFVQALLDYHFVPGLYYAGNITTTPQFPHTNLNDTAFTNVTGGQAVECTLDGTTVEIVSGLKSVSNVTVANLNYTGGVVHVIDRVLTLPPNVSTTGVDAGLTAFLGAANAANLTDTLDTAPDLTIFAPTNAAFEAIGSGLANLSTADLTSILEYHVLNGTVAYSSLLSNTTVTTLAGGTLTVTIEDGAVFVNAARVVNADILLSNGVLHVLDSVLNPNNTAVRNATATGVATAYAGATAVGTLALTSGFPAATATNAALVATESNVASGYAAATGGSTTATSGAAATGVMGAAALFGGAVFLANL
ncbi:TGF beta induced protein ig-h3 precursor [Teratosphaeria destructans]|uniref:TGF beta induced protein ig-h3 n=1 Tax=Teratosphaeria destructans TaxID=418781 RepID=A0A9W7SLT4_9PEZI|nr:TGF beta induced protein ig-h3 precursor [Teratosphaeria destructans]